MAEPGLRRATVPDAEGIAELANAEGRALHGGDDVTAEVVRSWLNMPDIHAVVAESGGLVVGYMDARRTPRGRVPLDVRVHPDAWGTGVAGALLEEAERWTAEHGRAGDLLRHFGVAEQDREVVDALRRAGYTPVRSSWEMRIDLDGRPPEPPTWPDGIAVRRARSPEDDAVVYETDMEAFEDGWDFGRMEYDAWRRWTVESPRFDPSLWFLASDAGEVAGICLSGPHRSGDPAWGWVDTLGVRKPWRGRGLGTALLRHAFVELHARGMRRVDLDVDTANESGAVRLYERAGMRAERRTETWEKPWPGP
jgi:mycothiol synthase